MKLLLDENLSRRLIPFLLEAYPESTQVALCGLASATDLKIWPYALLYRYIIMTRDADFEELSLVCGHPPQAIWLKSRNQSRPATLRILLENKDLIRNALMAEKRACVEITAR